MGPVKKNYEKIYNRCTKRVFDLFLALFLFLLLMPLFFLISAVILLSCGLPIFYRAERGGYHGKPFRIYKFRTMVNNADKTGGQTTAYNDKRITKPGKFLRKTKLDEIPQLLNIIKGDMSFAGPRPELLQYVLNYSEEERVILEVKPGITDYSSLEFIHLDILVGEKNADEVYEQIILPIKNKLRIKYALEVSFATDVKLILITFVKVLKLTAKYMNHIHS